MTRRRRGSCSPHRLDTRVDRPRPLAGRSQDASEPVRLTREQIACHRLANRFTNVVTVRSRPPARAERVRTGTPSRPAGVLAYEVAAAKCHAIDEGGAAVLPRSTSRGGSVAPRTALP